MRPLDPKLLSHAHAVRRYILLTALLGIATAFLAVAQALLLTHVIAGTVEGGQDLPDLITPLLALIGAVLLRTGVAWAQDRYGHRAATIAIAQLRQGLLRKIAALGPHALADGSGPALATLATRGLDNLDGYLVRYLPQLLLTAIVTPTVLAVIWWHDTLSGLTVLLTLPLVPLFLALVGMATQAAADRRLQSMQRLGGQVLDLLTGLGTLRALGRERGQAALVRQAGDDYRLATMGTLRSAFLSALVLESLTTLSVALVAVGVGLRMVHGDLDLRTGLTVIVLAPEAYLPLRMLGVQYHASVDGVAASQAATQVLERPVPALGTATAPDLHRTTIRFDRVTVVHQDSERPAPVDLSFDLFPGRILALAGDSGTGKTTALHVLLGLLPATSGQVLLQTDGSQPLSLEEVDPEGWYRQIAWVPQRPLIVPGTLAENVRLAAPQATDEELDLVMQLSGLEPVLDRLGQGWQTPMGQGGYGLSAGQRQRIGLARAFLRQAPLLVLDEPTAHLDAATERIILGTLERLRDQGTTILIVAHRSCLLDLAQDVVVVRTDRTGDVPLAPSLCAAAMSAPATTAVSAVVSVSPTTCAVSCPPAPDAAGHTTTGSADSSSNTTGPDATDRGREGTAS